MSPFIGICRAFRMTCPKPFAMSLLNIGNLSSARHELPVRIQWIASQIAVAKRSPSLKERGFRSILLVAGEHPKFVSTSYLAECVRALHPEIPSIALEVGPLDTDDYRSLVAAGGEGLVVYQETYDRTVYARVHTAGPKKNFDWRLETPERAYAAGFRRIGVGALHGLSDWRLEAICLAAHADYLLKNCWKAQLTISFPRLRPCAGEFEPLTHMTDRDLVQLI